MSQNVYAALAILGFCLVVVESQAGGSSHATFDFRSNCHTAHFEGKLFPTCNGNDKNFIEKDLFLNFASVSSSSRIVLLSFRNVTMYLSKSLKSVSIENVEEVILRHKKSEETDNGEMSSIMVKNVRKLILDSEREGEFPLTFRRLDLHNVDDIDLGSSLLNITATNITIADSNIYLKGRSGLILQAPSATFHNVTIYINQNGFLNLTVDDFLVKDAKIDIENGTIHFINSAKSKFWSTSFYNFEDKSLAVEGYHNITFVQNLIFTNDKAGVLSLLRNNMTFINNSFDCNNCSIKTVLLSTELGKAGDVNFCYASCNLTLNQFKELLNRNCLCDSIEPEVDDQTLCSSFNTDCILSTSTSVTDIDILRWVLLVTIPLVLIVSLLLCICHRDNLKRLRATASKHFLPQELECQRMEDEGSTVTDCSNCQQNEPLYEPVEPFRTLSHK